MCVVHESVQARELKIVPLKESLDHFPYAATTDFLAKMQHYSSLFAAQYRGKTKSSTIIALTHGLVAFLKTFFLKRGFLVGSRGLEISVYNGVTAFYKYLLLRDFNQAFVAAQLNSRVRSRSSSSVMAVGDTP